MYENDDLLKAESLIEQGDFQEAIAILSNIISINPKQSATVYLKLARAFESNDRLDESLATYEKVLARNPKHILAKSKVAKIKMRQGNILCCFSQIIQKSLTN